jgi:hypothetical protein
VTELGHADRLAPAGGADVALPNSLGTADGVAAELTQSSGAAVFHRLGRLTPYGGATGLRFAPWLC